MRSRNKTSEESPRISDRVPPKISPFRWALWWFLLFISLIIFYGLFAPFWFGLRLAAWTAEFRARRRRPKLAG